MKEFKITNNDQDRTIIKYLLTIFKDVPKHRIHRAFREKDVLVNNARIRNSQYKLQKNDIVKVYGIKSSVPKIKYENVKKYNLVIIYEDTNILIVSKPTGITTNGEANSLDKYVWSYLQFHQKDSYVPSSIGRLDKVSSGLITYAKNYQSLKQLKFKQKHFVKIYTFKSDLNYDLETNFKIRHDEKNNKQLCGKQGKNTKTIFKVIGNKKTAQIFTGRKHQIRATLEKIGFPIYGDIKYGGKKAKRVFLHCNQLIFQNLDGNLEYLNDKKFVDDPNW